MRDTATGESIAYDAESGRSISWFTFEGKTTASIDTNVAPGAPDRYPSSFISGHDLEDFVVATAREGRDSIDEHEVAGRAAWRYRGPVAENKLLTFTISAPVKYRNEVDAELLTVVGDFKLRLVE